MSASFSSMTESFLALADEMAMRLVHGSRNNSELRAALETVRLGDNAVRIGNWDILARDNEGSYRTYDIRSKNTGEIVVTNLPFYETARAVVCCLNAGATIQGGNIARVVEESERYHRMRADVEIHEARIEHYYARGDELRAAIHEDRLGVVRTRVKLIQDRLLAPSPHR